MRIVRMAALVMMAASIGHAGICRKESRRLMTRICISYGRRTER